MNRVQVLTTVLLTLLSVAILAAVTLGILVVSKKSLFVAAEANGKSISRLAVLTELERRYGKAMLGSMISKELIEEEARKQNVQVLDKEVQDDLAVFADKMKNEGKTLEDVLKDRGMQKADLEEQIRVQKLVVKMIAKDITITNDEITEEMKKINIPADAKTEELVSISKTVRENLQRQKLEQRYESWTKEVEQRSKIIWYVSYP